jgi:oxygen-independent coproporphyrinogen-3 oxidase
LSAEQIGRILSAMRENFVLCEDVEITLECNPMTHLSDGKEYFGDLRKLGINRLSLGIQSAVDSELKLIGRRHTFEEAKQTFFDARKSGFGNISVDLMFGIPSQTLESLDYSLEQFILLGAEHISIYSLQLEEGTPLYKMRDRYILADDDAVADMYESVVSSMKKVGYSHYEISNFAKVGKESRHNKKYWVLDEYLGLGLAAHSDFSGKRVENTHDMNKYLLGEYIEKEIEISLGEREFEFLMLGFRTSYGISKSEFFERFGIDFDEKYGKKIEKYTKMGYFLQNGDVVALSEGGFEVSNSILAQILDFDY